MSRDFEIAHYQLLLGGDLADAVRSALGTDTLTYRLFRLRPNLVHMTAVKAFKLFFHLSKPLLTQTS
jgi:hypothetical protein